MKEKIYTGNVEITTSNKKSWEKKLVDITKITGSLYINPNCELKVPQLTSVGCDFYINSNCELKALTSVGGYLSINSNCELKAPALTSVGGYLYIYSNCELKALTSVGGDLSINSNAELEKQLYPFCKKNKWHIKETSSEWLISKKPKNAIYSLNNFEFTREWFLKIKHDRLTPDEVFDIDNIEHRRIAYEFMDKLKMKKLKDYSVLDRVEDDGKGNPMQIVSFTVQNMKEPLLFYNCFCPSTKREYFIGTNKNTCNEAKSGSFGVDEADFINEW